MDKIAVLGDRESVLGFLALGLDVRPAETAQEGREALRELAQTCAVIFVTETLAQELAPEIARYKDVPASGHPPHPRQGRPHGPRRRRRPPGGAARRRL